MILRPTYHSLRLPLSTRPFSLLPTPPINRIFDPIRTPTDLHTLTLLSATANRPLITFWSARFCRTCASIKPLVLRLIEQEKVGEREGGLGFAEVLMDSALIGDLPVVYRVTSMPTLMAFARQEARFETRLVRPEEMRDEGLLGEWLVREARRGGRAGGGGGSVFGW